MNEYTKATSEQDQWIEVLDYLRNDYIDEICSISIGEYEFPSVEHAFQAAKTNDHNLKGQIEASSLREARKIGKSIQLPDDWEDKKIAIMEYLVRQKFFGNENIQWHLIETGKKEIKMFSKNELWNEHLPKILMKIRDELQFIKGWNKEENEKQLVNDMLSEKLTTSGINSYLTSLICDLYNKSQSLRTIIKSSPIYSSDMSSDLIDFESILSNIEEYFENDSLSEED